MSKTRIHIISAIPKVKKPGKKIDRLTIKVASIPDLIAMKKQAGRPQDVEDIKALEKYL